MKAYGDAVNCDMLMPSASGVPISCDSLVYLISFKTHLIY